MPNFIIWGGGEGKEIFWPVSVWPRSPAGQALQRHFCLSAGVQWGLCGV